MKIVNNLKEAALHILLEETFSYIHNNIYKAHVVLAEKNAKEQGVSACFFMYKGQVFPVKTPTGVYIQTIRVTAPPLHFSFYEEFEKINAMEANAGYSAIKNFFIAVLTHSHNGIVLNEFIPSLLLTRLRKDFTDSEYRVLDAGVPPMHPPMETIETTKSNISMIREHYADSIEKLRELLMERFLLQE